MNAPKAFESKEDVGHYVGGSVVNPQDGRFADVYNPVKGAVARRVALASRKEVDATVAVAQKAFESWSQTSPLRRSRILFKYLELVNAHRDELAAIITAEHGKVFTDAQGEVTVRLSKGGRIVNGVGTDPDIIAASAKAYLSALNKLHDPSQAKLNAQMTP